MKESPAGFNNKLMHDKLQVMTRQTKYYKLNKYLPGYLLRNRWISAEERNNEHINNIEALMQRSLPKNADSANPQFTYLHLLMPHHPHVYDSLGNKWSEEKTGSGDLKFG